MKVKQEKQQMSKNDDDDDDDYGEGSYVACRWDNTVAAQQAAVLICSGIIIILYQKTGSFTVIFLRKSQ